MTKEPALSIDSDEIDATVLTLLGERTDIAPEEIPEQAKPKRRGRKRKEPGQVVPVGTSAYKTDSTTEPKPVKRGRGRPSNASNAAAAAVASAERAAASNSPTEATGQEPIGEVCNAARERSRVKTLRDAFLDLQKSLPSVPPDTKLSKLDVLVLATTYIAHLMKTLDGEADAAEIGVDVRPGKEAMFAADAHDGGENRKHRLKADGYLHPVKKWPMRSRLYAGALLGCVPNA